MVDYLIRPANKKDSAEIRRLIYTVRINPTGLDWRHFYVAVSGQSELLGCGQIKKHRDGSSELASIAVKEEARGEGIARAIIGKLLTTTPARPLYLTCRNQLEPFYKKFGFQAINSTEMPLYFKRISRLVNMISRGRSPEDRLLVMRLD